MKKSGGYINNKTYKLKSFKEEIKNKRTKLKKTQFQNDEDFHK